jgi:carbon monoxide dehydrogenase subunit G
MAPWYLRPVSVVIEQGVSVDAAPKDVFAFLHDPGRRQQWDAMADLARLEEASDPAVGVRLHLRGRRTAPSWVGEYTELAPPRRSVLRLVEGVGMPFAAFTQTVEVAARDGGSAVTLRLEYEARGLGRMLEPVVLRPRLAKAVRRSVASIARHFA